MIRSLYLTLIYGLLLVVGVATPFACALGYVWVDTFTPQYIAYSILTEFPVSLVMGVTTALTYFFADMKYPPRPYLLLVLMVMMSLWCVFTTFNDPVAQVAAEAKFNWASKVMLFSCFMPFLFRSRVQIEALLLVFIFSLAAQFIPFGAKTLISGGGYGQALGLLSFNAGLGEGSFLAATCSMAIPLMWHLRTYGLIIPRAKIFWPLFPVLIVLAVATCFGTYERTALFGVGIALGGIVWRTRYRVITAVVVAGGVALFIATTSASWLERMSTVSTYNTEGSAYVRVLVWEWTLEFVKTHPFGGGFNSYYVNDIHVPSFNGGPELIEHGRAFHSLYFEMLGEHGWPGLILFVTMIAVTIYTLRKVARWADGDPEFIWLRNLSLSLLISSVAVFVCAAFIGIGFQPVVWYLFALTVMCRHHMHMCETLARPAAKRVLAEAESGGWEPMGA
jgi:probable O-glycosylation ligase (exosortase A-associated)